MRESANQRQSDKAILGAITYPAILDRGHLARIFALAGPAPTKTAAAHIGTTSSCRASASSRKPHHIPPQSTRDRKHDTESRVGQMPGPQNAWAVGRYFRSRRHVRRRTPRKHEDAGPVLLGPVSHRARLRVERSTEGRDHQRTSSYFRSRP